jgi:starch synthase (maltosyl-transferring)
MDAYTHGAEPGRTRAGATLRILYAAADKAGVSQASGDGFSHVLIAPPWPGDTRHGHFCARHFDGAAGTAARLAREAGMHLLIDLHVDRLSATAPLAAAQGSPFSAPDKAALLDPRRGAEADVASARLDSLGDALALAAWWAPRLQGFCKEGVAGFRVIGLDAFPEDLAGAFFGALRQALPNALLLAWTPGLSPHALQSLHGKGADGVFASLPWWDLTSDWLWDEVETLSKIAPVLGIDGLPGAPVAGDVARRAAFAATIGQGFVHVAAGSGETYVKPLNALLRDFPQVAGQKAPRPLSAGGPAWAFLRQDGVDHRDSSCATLVLCNADPNVAASVAAAGLLPATGGVFAPFRAVYPASAEALTAASVVSLKPGEFCVFVAEALTRSAARVPLDASLARQAASVGRLAVEQPTPAVDGGAFPVKAIAGELVSVEADVIFDGHDKIAVALRWQGPGESGSQEVPMRPLGNDRWQAAFPLAALGRHSYEIHAWRDRFETFRDELAKKSTAGVPIALELVEGEAMLRAAAARSAKPLAGKLQAVLAELGKQDEAARVATQLSPALAKLMQEADDRPFLATSAAIPVDAERIEARFSSWYEVFPRSMSDDPARHGTFRDVERHLPRIRDMGFDVLYFPPIHPIGTKNRKGRNNTLTPSAEDPGSPYAIGSTAGGHDALHPELGTLEDFAHLRQSAAAHGLELAIDFAIQCSPDHPWLKQHPGWFDWRPDGSIRYAENPPKKYEDIVNVDFYNKESVPDLWLALCDVVLFWAGQGVKLFRVDNPHTKPLPFWEWMIGQVRARHPDAIFLAEAFTRPKVMYRLAKVGFSQSYTYFTWRNSKRELEAYLTELDTEPPKDFFRPHFFVNTPDINPVFLQTSGRPGFLIRAALASTLSGLWGVYNGFELCEAAAMPGKEEYYDSEKYQIRAWDWDRPGNITAEITALNHMRRQNPALQTHRGVQFLVARNDAILYYEKATADRSNVVLVAVSLDPFGAQEADFELPLWRWSLPDQAALAAENLSTGETFTWYGKYQHLRLTPESPYAIWRVRPL